MISSAVRCWRPARRQRRRRPSYGSRRRAPGRPATARPRPRSRPVSGAASSSISSRRRRPWSPRRPAALFTRTYSASRITASSSVSAATTPTVTARYGLPLGPVGSKCPGTPRIAASVVCRRGVVRQEHRQSTYCGRHCSLAGRSASTNTGGGSPASASRTSPTGARPGSPVSQEPAQLVQPLRKRVPRAPDRPSAAAVLGATVLLLCHTQVDPTRVRRSERSELLGDHQRLVVGQQDPPEPSRMRSVRAARTAASTAGAAPPTPRTPCCSPTQNRRYPRSSAACATSTSPGARPQPTDRAAAVRRRAQSEPRQADRERVE